MTNEEAINLLDNLIGMIEDNHNSDYDTAFKMAIKALKQNESAEEWYKLFVEKLEQEPSGDAISRQAVLELVNKGYMGLYARQTDIEIMKDKINDLPPINPQEQKTGHCKDCKYFEYDSVAKVDGIPLIVAHEICSRWGDGCKTKEDGYCFLFEPRERSEKECR